MQVNLVHILIQCPHSDLFIYRDLFTNIEEQNWYSLKLYNIMCDPGHGWYLGGRVNIMADTKTPGFYICSAFQG